ncbi:MAG: sulfurtransferase-like selenium metabolism protein YedF [Syntrophomonadaceae bacterium]|nr:sulfurtransferase-like selenium metabolism protein YedF [Syntrophomonadaceae bacterium]
MTRTVDARGLSCPQPVILTKKLMDEKSGEEIVTIVDNPTARENVSKLAASQGYAVSVEVQGSDSHIHMVKEQGDTALQTATSRDIVILVKSPYFGQGDDDLGAALMKSFVYTLTEMADQMHTLIFMNGGVHLTTSGSPVLEHLRLLEEAGVQILSCGTCLDFYGTKADLHVGQVTNMYTATEVLFTAAKTLVL